MLVESRVGPLIQTKENYPMNLVNLYDSLCIRQTKKRINRALLFLGVLCLISYSPGLAQNNAMSNSPLVTNTGMAIIEGQLLLVWGDSVDGSQTTLEYFLIDEKDNSTRLVFDEALLQSMGENIYSSNGLEVILSGEWASRELNRTDKPIFLVQTAHIGSSPSNADSVNMSVPIIGSQPWVSILCKFADDSSEPKPLSFFEEMYANRYPLLDHYWRELSYGAITLSGSIARGWYTLPKPKSYYYYDRGTGYPEHDFQRLVEDCTAAADADVYFPDYVGVNIFWNTWLSAWSFGGSFPLTRDGVSRNWRMTWLDPCLWGTTIAGIEHEMGHGFGLPHSKSILAANYWDVMSVPPGWNPVTDPIYGRVGIHTIAYHKDILGWIPANQIYEIDSGNLKTLTLEQLAIPQTNNYKMIRIPIAGSTTQFYTVEARRRVGYDYGVQRQAVIIHNVDITRREPAQILDRDNNPLTFEDQDWTPGQIFHDSQNEITVCVNSATATGMVVTIGTGVFLECSFTANLSPSSVTADPIRPATGEQVRFSTRLMNWGAPAYGVVVTSTVPNGTTYVPGSAKTTQGTVSGSNPLIFNVGTMGYFDLGLSESVTLSFDATVNADIISPTILSGPVTIAWEGGSLSLTNVVIANGLAIYLPLIQR